MKTKLKIKFIILPLIIIFNLSANAQVKNNLVYTSELVIIDDSELMNVLNSIITKENSCSKGNNSIIWYMEFKESKHIIISQKRIVSLLELFDKDKQDILTTFINNQIVFIIVVKKGNTIFNKTGFLIDLSSYITEELIVYFEDFSSWLISDKNDSYNLLGSNVRNCN